MSYLKYAHLKKTKFVMFDSNNYVDFDKIYHNRSNLQKLRK